ncbi:MAG: ribulose-phosphate 3-epimerase [Verrucomicrobia bacterium]|nr:ribulose-phosphate 3-epimerase [Verrucomicrobiota bacterium]
MPEIKILPSILAADIGRLEEACKLCERSGADGLHVDVMDGSFVRNISMGPEVVRMAKKCTARLMNVHLMASRPDFYVEPFAEAGSDTLLIHIESECDVGRTLAEIRQCGMKPGVTLNPETPVEDIVEVLDEGLVEEVLFMTVHPGFGGQSFISEVLPKMRWLRDRCPDLDINVDGGINRETSVESARQGCNYFVIGTHLFRADDMATEIALIRESVRVAQSGSDVS